MNMAKWGKKRDAGDDAAARQAAEVAVELTEASDLRDGLGASAGDGAVASATAGGRRRSMRQVAGAIGAARTGLARQSSTMARRTSEAAGRSGQAATRGMSSAVTWLTGQVVAMGPRLRIRDQATLREQFPGRADEEIAELLIERAGRASAGVGGATGAWAALPVLPAFPAEVAAETLAVIGIELKLVAELHEVLGLPAQGSGTERARAYLGAWANRRGVFAVPGGFVLVAGSPLARTLRRRLVGRVRRSAFALGPVLTGAVAGAVLNRMETRKLGRQILADLRRHQREIGTRRYN
jgi:hypothetical protein